MPTRTEPRTAEAAPVRRSPLRRVLGVVLVVVLSLTASRTVAGIEGDLNEAGALVPDWLLLPLTLVAAFATLTLWIG